MLINSIDYGMITNHKESCIIIENPENNSIETHISQYNIDNCSVISDLTNPYDEFQITEVKSYSDLISEYIEPEVIRKVECFDEDMLLRIINDDNFNIVDRNYLKRYNKERRLSGGRAEIKYKFGTGCEKLRLGRLFAEHGLANFRFDIRNPIFKKYYWDIDFVNCHFYIAKYFLHQYGLPCDNIENYINNRNEWLAKTHPDRWVAKTKFLIAIYGGDIKLYNDNYEFNDININCNEVNELLAGIKKEHDLLQNIIWAENTHLHKVKFGKKGTLLERKNPKASLMSLIFQTKEREMLLFLSYFLSKKGRNMDVYIHDGGLVRKLKNEEVFPQEILREAEIIIEMKFGIKIPLTEKEITHNYEIVEENNTIYKEYKEIFEKEYFMLQGKMINIMKNDELYPLSIKECADKCKPLNWEEIVDGKKKKVYFFDKWLEDKTRRGYERIDFLPNQNEEGVYNLFTGFNAEKFRPEFEMTDNEISELIYPIIEHLNYLCEGDASYFLKWLANIIQNPEIKSEVAPLFRDMNTLFSEGGGLGKNLFFDWFGYEILGSKYYQVVGTNKDLFSDFNGLFEGKLLVLIEEADSKSNHQNIDTLKSKVTGKKINVNKKNINQYSVIDYTRYAFNSNNYNSIPSNRRFFFYDCIKTKKGDYEYFKNLNKHLKKVNVKWAFYVYLKNLKTYRTPIGFENNRPKTKSYLNIKKINAPIHLKWIIDMAYNRSFVDGNVEDLYNIFINWVKEKKHDKDVDKCMTLTAFGIMLNKSIEVDKDCFNIGVKEKKRIRTFNWNITEVIQALKKMDLINRFFDYNDDTFDYCETLKDIQTFFGDVFEEWKIINNIKYQEILLIEKSLEEVCEYEEESENEDDK